MSIANQISAFKNLYALVGVSLLFFVIKGIRYALIGSYVPLVFILIVIGLLYWSFSGSVKTHRRVLRFWTILILVWSVVRLGLWGYLKVDTNLTESHLREQFGLVQNLISLGMLIAAILTLKEIKKQRMLTAKQT